MKNISKNTIGWIISVFFIWRGSLLLLAFISILVVPVGGCFLGGGLESYQRDPLLWGWANFDGDHYLRIAKNGYVQFQQAFFPFYPLSIRYFHRFFHIDYLTAGLLISNLSLPLALYLLYRLVRLDFSESISRRTIVYLLLFPTSFFFGSVYTESFFLLLVVGSFYAARKKKWGLAGFLGALASSTRVVGIFLFPALVWHWWQENENKKNKKFADLVPLFLISFGLLVYMYYLNRAVGDSLYFFHAQPFFGANRSGERLILIYQVLWRYGKMLVTVEKLTPTYFTVVLEAIAGFGFLFLTVFTYLRKWFPYLIFMALAYLAPTLTGTFSSVPRYVLILFPGFMLLAIWAEKYPWVRRAYFAFCLPFLVATFWLFFRGYFVA